MSTTKIQNLTPGKFQTTITYLEMREAAAPRVGAARGNSFDYTCRKSGRLLLSLSLQHRQRAVVVVRAAANARRGISRDHHKQEVKVIDDQRGWNDMELRFRSEAGLALNDAANLAQSCDVSPTSPTFNNGNRHEKENQGQTKSACESVERPL